MSDLLENSFVCSDSAYILKSNEWSGFCSTDLTLLKIILEKDLENTKSTSDAIQRQI